jgi:hypothetical protein
MRAPEPTAVDPYEDSEPETLSEPPVGYGSVAPPSEVRRSARAGAAALQQVRVSVRTSVRDPNLFIVRPLAEGVAAPPGTREAFLVLPDPPDDRDMRETMIDDGWLTQ